jgi:ABC-type branched-subunit amino acid transport system substrate-binding protein
VIVGAMAMEIMQLGNPYYMRIVSNTEVNGRAMAIAARHGNYKRPAIIYLNDYFGNSLRKIMEKEMALMSLEIVSSQSFDTYTTDMGPQVMKILAAKPDLVFLIAYAGDAVTALRTFKAQGYKGNYVGYSAMQHNATRAGAGYDVDGILFPSGNHTQGFYIWNRPGVIPLLLKLEAANPVGKYRLVNASPELSMLDGYQAIYTYKAWIELTGERGLKDKDYFMDVVAKSKINSFCYNLSFPQGRAMMEAFTIQDAYLRIYDKGHMRMWNADPRCIETFEATRVQAEEEIYGKGFTEGVTFRKYLARWQELLREKEAKVKGEIDEKLQKKIITDEYASMFKQALGEILAYKF